MDRYRIYCTTDQKVEYCDSLGEPTKCPVDPNHIIDSTKTTLIESAIPDTEVVGITDNTEKAIDESYDHKLVDGQAYYRKKRAQLVKKILIGDISEADADFIDIKLERVQQKINTGDWKSAKNRLTEITIEGAFTQPVYDEYESEIDNYIANHY